MRLIDITIMLEWILCPSMILSQTFFPNSLDVVLILDAIYSCFFSVVYTPKNFVPIPLKFTALFLPPPPPPPVLLTKVPLAKLIHYRVFPPPPLFCLRPNVFPLL